MRFLKLSAPVLSLLVVIFVAGCQTSQPLPQNTPAVATQAITEVVPEPPAPTATPEPPDTLVMCVQEEPQTLYAYGGSSRSMWSVLEAIYDGPIDTRGYQLEPVILEKLPSLADGDAAIITKTVQDGDAVVDVNGNLVALKAGVTVLPAGCSQPDCAVTWDGAAELVMEQLSVRFKLLPGLKWSDGQPLTAADSVFSYSLAADPATPVSKNLTDRTFSYTAVDEQTVEWVGMPGYYEQNYGLYFFLPLPEHVLGSFAAKDLINEPAAARSPLGWGPYAIQEWIAGDHITLRKNEHYFRASEGLPKFETLVYRFVSDTADGNMNALLAGECDVVDQNAQFLEMVPGLLEREKVNRLKIYVAQGPEWEHLDFGIRPASYDDGYDPAAGDRPDLFGDARTRQAFAYCIDRAAINNNLLYGRSIVQNAYVPPAHPQYTPDLPGYAYNPTEGTRLLDEVGWKDTDNNADTPRVASGVVGVPDGTLLSVTYLTTEASLRQQASQAAAASLRGCGIGVQVQTANPGELFGPGPDGLVFGRKFDLVQFSWDTGSRPNCQLYASSQTPDVENQWIGANVTGYASTEFDAACASAKWARSDDPTISRAAQEIFARDLPVIPLYAHLKIAIARPDLCGFALDSTARSIFWNVESFEFGACQ